MIKNGGGWQRYKNTPFAAPASALSVWSSSCPCIACSGTRPGWREDWDRWPRRDVLSWGHRASDSPRSTFEVCEAASRLEQFALVSFCPFCGVRRHRDVLIVVVAVLIAVVVDWCFRLRCCLMRTTMKTRMMTKRTMMMLLSWAFRLRLCLLVSCDLKLGFMWFIWEF